MDPIICHDCGLASRYRGLHGYASTEALHRHFQRCHNPEHQCIHCAPPEKRKAAVLTLERAATRLELAGEDEAAEDVRKLLTKYARLYTGAGDRRRKHAGSGSFPDRGVSGANQAQRGQGGELG